MADFAYLKCEHVLEHGFGKFFPNMPECWHLNK